MKKPVEPTRPSWRFRPLLQAEPNHCPAEGRYGDCYSTSIAMVLGLERDEVPHFMRQHLETGVCWRKLTNDWLAQFGLMLFEIPFSGDGPFDQILETLDIGGDTAVMISGQSSRYEDGHQCVVYQGRVIDPSPIGRDAGPPHFAGPHPADGMYWVTFLVPTPGFGRQHFPGRGAGSLGEP